MAAKEDLVSEETWTLAEKEMVARCLSHDKEMREQDMAFQRDAWETFRDHEPINSKFYCPTHLSSPITSLPSHHVFQHMYKSGCGRANQWAIAPHTISSSCCVLPLFLCRGTNWCNSAHQYFQFILLFAVWIFCTVIFLLTPVMLVFNFVMLAGLPKYVYLQ